MPKRNIAWVLVVFVIALVMWQLPQTIAGRDAVLRAFGPLVNARAEIHRHYVHEIDDEKMVDKAVDAAIEAMIKDLDDPYAVYLNAENYAHFQDHTKGHYGGIGVEVCASPGGLEVLSRERGSPAQSEGILPGDVIVKIDGQDLAEIPAVEAVNQLLNGVVGTDVDIMVRRDVDGSPELINIKLHRADISIEPVRGWRRNADHGWDFFLDAKAGLGYVRLVKFTPDIDEQLRIAVRDMLNDGLKMLVLDLRENSGGLLDSAWEVADMFLSEGLIVKTSGRNSPPQQWYAASEGTFPKFKMAILVNEATASASEIVSGALRDNKRAAIFGQRTFGKGSVQELIPLADSGGAIKLTTRYYYLPSGVCIHRMFGKKENEEWGVKPTHPVELTDDDRANWRKAWREFSREAVSDHLVDINNRNLDLNRLLTLDKCLNEAVAYLKKAPVSNQ